MLELISNFKNIERKNIVLKVFFQVQKSPAPSQIHLAMKLLWRDNLDIHSGLYSTLLSSALYSV